MLLRCDKTGDFTFVCDVCMDEERFPRDAIKLAEASEFMRESEGWFVSRNRHVCGACMHKGDRS